MEGYEPVLDILVIKQPQRRHRIFRERRHFEEDSDWQQRSCLNPDTFEFLLQRVEHRLEPTTQRSQALSAREQLLSALRYFASNSVYHAMRDAHRPPEATMCQVIKKVVAAINEELNIFLFQN